MQKNMTNGLYTVFKRTIHFKTYIRINHFQKLFIEVGIAVFQMSVSGKHLSAHFTSWIKISFVFITQYKK